MSSRRTSPPRHAIVPLLMLTVLLAGCGDDPPSSATGPDPIADDSRGAPVGDQPAESDAPAAGDGSSSDDPVVGEDPGATEPPRPDPAEVCRSFADLDPAFVAAARVLDGGAEPEDARLAEVGDVLQRSVPTAYGFVALGGDPQAFDAALEAVYAIFHRWEAGEDGADRELAGALGWLRTGLLHSVSRVCDPAVAADARDRGGLRPSPPPRG